MMIELRKKKTMLAERIVRTHIRLSSYQVDGTFTIPISVVSPTIGNKKARRTLFLMLNIVVFAVH